MFRYSQTPLRYSFGQDGSLGGRGRICPWASVRAVCEHWRRHASGRGGDIGAAAQQERARLASAQASLVESKARKLAGELVEASAGECEWSDILRGVRAGMLAVPSRAAQRLPHLTPHEVAEIDAEVREALMKLGE
jgi:phage terminase Nu1 subunit (DNA packaging protein)